jgi:hypothetical protein
VTHGRSLAGQPPLLENQNTTRGTPSESPTVVRSGQVRFISRLENPLRLYEITGSLQALGSPGSTLPTLGRLFDAASTPDTS